MKKMKRTTWCVWIVSVALFAGCSGTGDLIRKQSISTRPDVYMDLTDKTPIPPGFSDLRISFSVKTHTPIFHLLEGRVRGTSEYILVLNIDGQAATAKGTMTEENTRDEQPHIPETGNGIRYRFRKDLRLKAGAHKVFVAVPEDEVAIEKEIRLEDGTRNELLLEPVYGTGKRFGKRGPNFYSHLSEVRLLINGNPL